MRPSARGADDPQVFESGFRLSHAWVVDVASKKATEVVHGDFTVKGAPTWSPDGARLAYARRPTTMLRETRTDAYVVSVADQRNERISTKGRRAGRASVVAGWRTLAYATLPQSHTARADSISDVNRSGTVI